MSTLKVNNVTDLGDDAIVTDGVVVGDALPTGSILQVVSTVKTNIFSMSSGTFADVTDLFVTITPSSNTSKILILGSVFLSTNTEAIPTLRLLRDSTVIFAGASSGTRPLGFFGAQQNQLQAQSSSPVFFDEPSTTDAITYKIQVRINTGTAYVNQTGQDTDGTYPRTASSITVMEVAG